MKKISVIVRAPSRDFSPARAAIHSFAINGKIVKLIAGRKEYPKNVPQIFPEYFLHASSLPLTQRFQSLHIRVFKFNTWSLDSITINQS